MSQLLGGAGISRQGPACEESMRKWRTFFIPSSRLLVTVSLALLAMAWGSSGAWAAEPAEESLTLEAIIAGFRDKNALHDFEKARSKAAQSLAESQSLIFQSAPKLGLELETPPEFARSSSLDATSPERSATVRLEQEIVFGVDSARTAKQFGAKAKAEMLERKIALREEEQDIVSAYLDLRQSQLIYAALESAGAKVRELRELARKASRLGTLGALTATQAELFADEVKTELAQSELTYASLSERLSVATGIALPKTVGNARVVGLPKDFANEAALIKEKAPELRVNRLRLNAIASERENILARRALDVGVGVARSWGEKDETSVMLEVTLPLGSGAAAKSEAQSLGAERAALLAEATLLERKFERAVAKSDAEIRRLTGAVASTESRAERLSELYERTSGAFQNGQADLAEVLETLKEATEAKLNAFSTRRELESALVSRRYLSFVE